jgi:hypothetical protein
MLTESSGDWMSESLYECQNDFFVDLKGSYCHTGAIAGTLFPNFPLIEDWRGQFLFPPSRKQIQELVELAAKSRNTLSGVSDDERHKQELQGQGCKIFLSLTTHSVL